MRAPANIELCSLFPVSLSHSLYFFKVLLVLGGQAPKAIKSVEVYDYKDERWYQVSEMLNRRCRCGELILVF